MWAVVGLDRFEDEGDPFYRISEHETEKQAKHAARDYLSRPAKFAGGQDDIFIVSPGGEKRRVKT